MLRTEALICLVAKHFLGYLIFGLDLLSMKHPGDSPRGQALKVPRWAHGWVDRRLSPRGDPASRLTVLLWNTHLYTRSVLARARLARAYHQKAQARNDPAQHGGACGRRQ